MLNRSLRSFDRFDATRRPIHGNRTTACSTRGRRGGSGTDFTPKYSPTNSKPHFDCWPWRPAPEHPTSKHLSLVFVGWYLPKVGCHLYYTFDENEVIVRALWGRPTPTRTTH